MTSAQGFLFVVLSGIVSYLIGSINLSILMSKLMGKGDIREQGSKNAGTTNTLRVLGKGPALVVFVWDVLKGAIAVFVARWIAGLVAPDLTVLLNNYIYVFGVLISSLAVILGHNYPIYFGFKGGKGVATSLGVILAIEWRIGLVCLAAGIVGIALFQFVSVGSLIAAIEYPILVCILGGQFDKTFLANVTTRVAYITFSFILAIMVIVRHKTNIERIKNGTENKLRFRKTPEEKIAEEKEKMEVKIEEKVEETKEEIEKTEEKVEEGFEKIDIKLEPKKEEDKGSKKKGKK